jgi:hypothetical protein
MLSVKQKINYAALPEVTGIEGVFEYEHLAHDRDPCVAGDPIIRPGNTND